MSTLATIEQQTLPSLVQRAASQLASATSAAEVLEARDMAGVAYDAAKKAARLGKAKGAHDELIAKAHRAQADALEIEALAKRRLADEYDAAQDRGEAATVGKPVNVPNGNNKATAAASLMSMTRHRRAARCAPSQITKLFPKQKKLVLLTSD